MIMNFSMNSPSLWASTTAERESQVTRPGALAWPIGRASLLEVVILVTNRKAESMHVTYLHMQIFLWIKDFKSVFTREERITRYQVHRTEV